MKTHGILLITLTSLLSPLTHAAKPEPKKAAPAPKIDSADPAPKSSVTSATPGKGDKLLWDSWYTVTIQKKIPYAYYNDRVEIRQGRVVFQNHFWKNEEGFINEEQLGAFAQNDENLTPLFFNFHSTYRATETLIDGNVKDGRLLTVKIRQGDRELPLVKKNIPEKVFFSSQFQVWLGKRLASLKPGSTLPFHTLLEDNLEMGYSAVHGRLTVEKPDAFATQSKTTKIKVDHQDRKTTWYVEANGNPVRIDMPEQKALVERVPEAVARKFLDK